MEEQNSKPAQKYARISLLTFIYVLCGITILSLVCLVYALHQRNKATDAKLNRLENSISTVQTTKK